MRCTGLAIAMTAFLGVCAPALANEPMDPVKTVMNLATKSDGDYFSASGLLSMYSLAFTRDMVAAILKTKEMDGEMLLDYDPVIGGQDNCPLKNISYKQGPQKGKKLTVRVEFAAGYCMGNKANTKVDFDMVQEGVGVPSAWYYIDDIRHIDKDGKTASSLRQTLKEIAAQ